ncbi:KAP family P-loop NTPase fold protein [Burkholderia perseverans]|uniref:KAP family P-loop NTPase fold protein n=1 Tax=Burkholderia perseverans TaxID=2615214 RepID=UPI001FEEA470|nr:P-loop NTPase fold protein [Burkholderia perseverans]
MKSNKSKGFWGILIALWVRISMKLAHLHALHGAHGARSQVSEGGIGAEAPIRTSAEDKLRRTDFADRIASVLSELTLSEGRVFSIRGGWGFGKSSLKNLITERLDARCKQADWLDFNPWQWGDGEAISHALFGQIADRLGGEHSRKALARAKALRSYGAILTGASSSLKQASKSNNVITVILTNASLATLATAIGFNLPNAAKAAIALATVAIVISLIGQLLTYLGRDHGSDPIDKMREALEKRLCELDHPLVVFVDDIDRLEPDQIRTLLRQIKANANLPNIVFVLIFQSSIVEKALHPVAGGDGRAFLEKVVQANFDLPEVSKSTVHQIFASELETIADSYATEANGFTVTRWGNASVGCILPLVRNLRDARRLISSISVHMPLHVDHDVFEVNLIDFLLLEALRVFEPDLHKALFAQRDLLIQEGRYDRYRGHERDQAEAERLLELVPAERKLIAQDAMKELFPPIEWAYGGTRYSDGFHVRWLAEKRVCTSRFFARYFELQTPIGEVSEQRFVRFIEAAAAENTLDMVVADLEVNQLLPSMVARLDEAVDRLPIEHAAVLLPGLFRIAEKVLGSRSASPFNSPWVSAWRSTHRFVKRIPEDLRGGLMLEALRKTEALSLAAMLIHLNDPDDIAEEDKGAFEPTLNHQAVRELKDEWLQIIRIRSAGAAMIDASDLATILYRWAKYSGSLSEPRKWVEEKIQPDEGFAIVASRLMSRSSVYSAGDRVSTPRNIFSKETIEDFIGIKTAKARCDAIDPAKFPQHTDALRTLHRSLELWLGLRERDLHDLP